MIKFLLFIFIFNGLKLSIGISEISNKNRIIRISRELIADKIKETTKTWLKDNLVLKDVELPIKIWKSKEGDLIGVTSDLLDKSDLAKNLYLRNGDVILSINNDPIRNVQDLVDIFIKYSTAKFFRTSLLREGKIQTLTYYLE